MGELTKAVKHSVVQIIKDFNVYFHNNKVRILSETKPFLLEVHKVISYLVCSQQQLLFWVQTAFSRKRQHKQPLNISTIFVGYPGTGKYFLEENVFKKQCYQSCKKESLLITEIYFLI